MSVFDKIGSKLGLTPEEMQELKAELVSELKPPEYKAQPVIQQPVTGGNCFVPPGVVGMRILSNDELKAASKRRAELEAQKGKSASEIDAEVAAILR